MAEVRRCAGPEAAGPDGAWSNPRGRCGGSGNVGDEIENAAGGIVNHARVSAVVWIADADAGV